MKKKETAEILESKKQLTLFGYENYFNFFIKLTKKNIIPNSMLISGQKGLGKSTFIYHFLNYLLSNDQKHPYNLKDLSIDSNNSDYKLLQSNTHPNLFVLDAIDEDNIKIEKIRNLLLFLNKTTYQKNLKIILIDDAEYLNVNSSNALLKAIEEPRENTYFFIINNESKQILNTIKSRCVNFKINFNLLEKKNIFNNIAKKYNINFKESDIDNFLSFDTHGNLLKYLILLNNPNLKISENYLSCVSYFMDLYKTQNDSKILDFISLFIQYYYNQLSLKKGHLISEYYRNFSKIVELINNTKNYHLDKKNLIFSIDKIIKNER